MACKNLKTNICDEVDFIKRSPTSSKSSFEGHQALIQLGNSWVWTRANRFVQKLRRVDINLAEATAEMQTTKTNLQEYKEQSLEVSSLVIKYEKGYESDDLDFAKVQPSGFNEQEHRIFSDYTDATCKQA